MGFSSWVELNRAHTKCEERLNMADKNEAGGGIGGQSEIHFNGKRQNLKPEYWKQF